MRNRKTGIDHWNELNFIPPKVEDLPGEIWIRCKNYPNYAVSNKERVKCLERVHFGKMNGFLKGKYGMKYYPEHLMKPTKSSNGYWKVTLTDINGKQHTESLHKLVGDAFIPNPNPEIYIQFDHIDGNPDNNKPENLKRSTQAENNNNPIRRNRISESKKGTKKQPLTDEQKAKISNTLKSKNINCKPVICDGIVFKSAKEAANFYAVVPSTMRNWLNGRNPMPEPFAKMGLTYKG